MASSSERFELPNYGQYSVSENPGGLITAPIVHLSKCVLHAPSPNGPPPTTRPKPPGCKTVFVGGLPENANENIMREIFQMSGEIKTVRMSTKNFCHIRFADESYVDRAINFSGYRIKIDNKDDAPNTGRLHVDYAHARDDQFDYQVNQRSLQREARHQDREFRPPTPPPVAHYTDHEATALSAKLRDDETFQSAASTLITWLERGECTKRNAGYFYSMIQSTNSHIHRLQNEKYKYERELKKAESTLKQQMDNIFCQLGEIGKVFNAAIMQKVWDHFTKAQRKNIQTWKKEMEDIRDTQMRKLTIESSDGEMDLSDDEVSVNSSDEEGSLSTEEIEKLKEENDTLRCQLAASQNEVLLARSELQAKKAEKEEKMKVFMENMQNEYKNLFAEKKSQSVDPRLSSSSRKRDASDSRDSLSKKSATNIDDDDEANCHSPNNVVTSSSASSFSISESEARLIGVISMFLNTHPFGASIDYICSYLQQIDTTVITRDVESLMRKFPDMFKEESSGIGASLEKKWLFCGFKN